MHNNPGATFLTFKNMSMQFKKDKFQLSAQYTPFAINVVMDDNDNGSELEFKIDHSEFETWLDSKGKLTYDEKAYTDPKRGVVHEVKQFYYHDFVRAKQEDKALTDLVIEFLEEEKTLI